VITTGNFYFKIELIDFLIAFGAEVHTEKLHSDYHTLELFKMSEEHLQKIFSNVADEK